MSEWHIYKVTHRRSVYRLFETPFDSNSTEVRNDRIKDCSSGVSPEEDEERGGVGFGEEADR